LIKYSRNLCVILSTGHAGQSTREIQEALSKCEQVEERNDVCDVCLLLLLEIPRGDLQEEYEATGADSVSEIAVQSNVAGISPKAR